MRGTRVIPINDLTRGIAQSDKASEAVIKVLRSGHWVHGPEHALFENEFAQFLNVDYLLGVASGTDAIEIALRAVGCSNGSKIISVANAGGYTSVAAASIGCEVIYCDVDYERHVMDPIALAPLLSKEISAVVVTHLYGNIAPISTIKMMCDSFGIAVIEDCAQAVGGYCDGQHVGSVGDIGAFSFYPTKNLGGIGDGGALSTNNEELAAIIASLRQYGWNPKYQIRLPGGKNSRLDEIQAAVLRIGLKGVLDLSQRRTKIVGQYSKSLENSAIKLVTSHNEGSAGHLAVLLLPATVDRNEFRKTLREAGVQTDIHYPILDTTQLGLRRGREPSFLPISENSAEKIVSIPLFPQLTDTEIELICHSINSYPA